MSSGVKFSGVCLHTSHDTDGCLGYLEINHIHGLKLFFFGEYFPENVLHQRRLWGAKRVKTPIIYIYGHYILSDGYYFLIIYRRYNLVCVAHYFFPDRYDFCHTSTILYYYQLKLHYCESIDTLKNIPWIGILTHTHTSWTIRQPTNLLHHSDRGDSGQKNSNNVL